LSQEELILKELEIIPLKENLNDIHFNKEHLENVQNESKDLIESLSDLSKSEIDIYV